MRKLIKNTLKEVGFQKGVKVFLYNDELTPAGYCGSSQEFDDFYRIEIAKKNVRGLYEILAHELAHAITDELYPDTELHGKEFVAACCYIKALWETWGIQINHPYNKEIDE
jgi:predicted SprT family Zn-dependent metalloprotease